MKRINKLKSLSFLIFCLFLISCQDGCNTDISKVSNKIPIEIRVVGVLNQDEAKKEIIGLLKGINFEDGYRVPVLSINDITFDTDSTKRKHCIIKIPLATTDAASLEISGNVLDQATYQTNLDEALESDFENDTSFSKGLTILTGKRGNRKLINKLPNVPPLSNEFFITTSNLSKSDPTKHTFKTAEELIAHIEQSKLKLNNLIVYYMGGELPTSLQDDDKDGVSNDIDQCPEKKGSISCNGCECPSNDRDGDGILNTVDGCPDKKGPKDNNGCPWPDADNDGTPDKFDKCPNKAGNCNGCECPSNDRDNDKVINSSDKCPDEYGPASNGGCPLKPSISHNNNDGKFYFENVDLQKQTVELTIKLNDGTTKIVYPQNRSYPNVGEYDNLTRELTQAAGITVIIKVIDKASKTPVLSTPFIRNDLSLVCLKPEPGSPKKCGFMNTDL